MSGLRHKAKWRCGTLGFRVDRIGDVDLWLAALDLPAASVKEFETFLSDDERRRADRFHFARDRRRFVVARGVLRSVLGQHLKERPEDVQFCYEPLGKPYLRLSGEPKLRFNVSHANELALIGLCLGSQIGIDIEHKDQDRATLEIARCYFAPEEVSELAVLPAEAQSDAFFTIWTLKEAYIKARGEGVSLGLDTFAITLDADRRPALVRSALGDDELKRWRFWLIDIGPAYSAALAVEGIGERCLSLRDATPR